MYTKMNIRNSLSDEIIRKKNNKIKTKQIFFKFIFFFFIVNSIDDKSMIFVFSIKMFVVYLQSQRETNMFKLFSKSFE